MHIQLQPGTILDERYRIDAVLGQGGFGITYAAENIRVGLKVAIKELFWRSHCLRPDQTSQEIALADATDAQLFEEQKQRFLREARTIRDFSGQAGVVGILDYFEANNTAYIVMEYVEGETLAARFAEGSMACEELLRRFLPIIDTLDIIHRAGVIHRDISPDNIMIQSDGSLKLIDFGAARQYQSGESHYTAISKNSYSPCEQYDRNGHQGPWTDVYALCATLYACVCGTPPQGALQRMFLDELKAPSQLGVSITPAYESIIMRGLQLRTEKRWQSMDELAKAIRAALPKEKPASNNRRGVVIGLLAGLMCAALALGVWGWRRYDETHKFRGIETEQIRFEATEDTTAAEFAAAQVELRKRLDDFAGKNNYMLTVDGDSLALTLPFSLFDGHVIKDVIDEHFSNLVPDKNPSIIYELKANWEDPAHSPIAGENQVLPEALEEPSVLVRYGWDESELLTPLSRGQRANLIVDFKARVDALDVPYAFGTACDDDNSIILKTGPDHMGGPILQTISKNGSYFDLTILPSESASDWPSTLGLVKAELIQQDNVTVGLRFSFISSDSEKIEEYTRAMHESGLEKLYLVDFDRNPVAFATVSEPVTDGVIEFRDFLVENTDSTKPDNSWLIEYYNTLFDQTELPAYCYWLGFNYMDADGQLFYGTELYHDGYGVGYTSDETCQVMLDRLRAAADQYGYEFREVEIGHKGYWELSLGLPLNENLPALIEEKLSMLLDELFEGQRMMPKTLIIRICNEETEDNNSWLRSRMVIETCYRSGDEGSHFQTYDQLILEGESIEPWKESIEQWWDESGRSRYGLEKYASTT